MDDYYEAKIYHIHPNSHIIRKLVKEDRIILSYIIYLSNKSKRPYSSTIYSFITNVEGS